MSFKDLIRPAENTFSVILEENHDVNKRKVSLPDKYNNGNEFVSQFDKLSLKQQSKTYSSIIETESRFVYLKN